MSGTHACAGEIQDQVRIARQILRTERRELTNVVYMGMGEPLYNLENVAPAIETMADGDGLSLSKRRITVSTSGIIPRIKELGESAIRPKLAISLNASTEEQRRELMPVTRKYHLADLIDACRAYPLRPWEKLTFEYVLLKGVNDTAGHDVGDAVIDAVAASLRQHCRGTDLVSRWGGDEFAAGQLALEPALVTAEAGFEVAYGDIVQPGIRHLRHHPTEECRPAARSV